MVNEDMPEAPSESAQVRRRDAPPVWADAASSGEQDALAGLLGRAAGGDVAAFGALHARLAGPVRAYFLRCAFGLADAEDLSQEVFLRLYKAGGSFDARRGSFRSWLATIARNVARAAARRRRGPEQFDPEMAEEMLVAERDSSLDLETREQVEGVRACIATMEPELARVLRLRYVEGRTTRGIAAAVELPESTVRLRLAEGRQIVERYLRGRGLA